MAARGLPASAAGYEAAAAAPAPGRLGDLEFRAAALLVFGEREFALAAFAAGTLGLGDVDLFVVLVLRASTMMINL